jgi:hypothetical protein
MIYNYTWFTCVYMVIDTYTHNTSFDFIFLHLYVKIWLQLQRLLFGSNWLCFHPTNQTQKNTRNLKVMEFEIFENSKYVSSFKSLLPHVNGV